MKSAQLPILLAEDVSIESSHNKRSKAVKDHVVAIAVRLGSSIDLVYVEDFSLYPVSKSQYPSFIDQFMTNQKNRLKEIAHSKKIKIQPLFLSGEIVPKLLEQSQKGGQYDFLALGTHGRKGLSRLILGSVAEEVIRNSKLPVLVVGAEAQKHSSVISEKGEISILVATDLGENTERAEKFALDLAKRLNAGVTLFHSLFESFHPVIQTALSSPRGKRELDDLFQETKTDALKKLEKKVQDFSSQGILCEARLDDRTRDAGQGILKEAGKGKHALVIMGTHGRSLMAQAFLGSSVRQVILEARVPVFAVRSN